MRLKVITAYDENYACVGDMAARSIRIYAAANNLDYEIFPIPPMDRPPAWAKIQLILDQFSKTDADFVLWVDADACFVSADLNIADFIKDGKDLYLVNHAVKRQYARHGVFLLLERPNTGVMLLRNSQWSRQFLQDVWSMTKYTNHFWWENAAIMDLLGFRLELTGNLDDNAPEESVLNKVEWLPLVWNCIPYLDREETSYFNEVLDPIIVHYAGIAMKARIPLMQAHTMSTKISLRQ